MVRRIKISKQDWARSRRLGEQLRMIRKNRGVSAKFVALTIEKSQAYISDLEMGRRCFTPALEDAYRKAIQ